MNIASQSQNVKQFNGVIHPIWDQEPAASCEKPAPKPQPTPVVNIAIVIDVKLPGLAAIAREMAVKEFGSSASLCTVSPANLSKRCFLAFKAQDGSTHNVELWAMADGTPPGDKWKTYCEALSERLRVVAGCAVVEDSLSADGEPAQPALAADLTRFMLWDCNGFGPLLQPAGHPLWPIAGFSSIKKDALAKTPAILTDRGAMGIGNGISYRPPPKGICAIGKKWVSAKVCRLKFAAKSRT